MLFSLFSIGFYSIAGAFSIAGIHGLPPYLYFWTHRPKSWDFLDRIQPLLIVPIVVLGVGRLLGLLVEVRGGEGRGGEGRGGEGRGGEGRGGEGRGGEGRGGEGRGAERSGAELS